MTYQFKTEDGVLANKQDSTDVTGKTTIITGAAGTLRDSARFAKIEQEFEQVVSEVTDTTVAKIEATNLQELQARKVAVFAIICMGEFRTTDGQLDFDARTAGFKGLYETVTARYAAAKIEERLNVVRSTYEKDDPEFGKACEAIWADAKNIRSSAKTLVDRYSTQYRTYGIQEGTDAAGQRNAAVRSMFLGPNAKYGHLVTTEVAQVLANGLPAEWYTGLSIDKDGKKVARRLASPAKQAETKAGKIAAAENKRAILDVVGADQLPDPEWVKAAIDAATVRQPQKVNESNGLRTVESLNTLVGTLQMQVESTVMQLAEIEAGISFFDLNNLGTVAVLLDQIHNRAAAIARAANEASDHASLLRANAGERQMYLLAQRQAEADAAAKQAEIVAASDDEVVTTQPEEIMADAE